MRDPTKPDDGDAKFSFGNGVRSRIDIGSSLVNITRGSLATRKVRRDRRLRPVTAFG